MLPVWRISKKKEFFHCQYRTDNRSIVFRKRAWIVFVAYPSEQAHRRDNVILAGHGTALPQQKPGNGSAFCPAAERASNNQRDKALEMRSRWHCQSAAWHSYDTSILMRCGFKALLTKCQLLWRTVSAFMRSSTVLKLLFCRVGDNFENSALKTMIIDFSFLPLFVQDRETFATCLSRSPTSLS